MRTKQQNVFYHLGNWQDIHGRGKYVLKARKLSGNYIISQGIFELSIKSRKSQGILK